MSQNESQGPQESETDLLRMLMARGVEVDRLSVTNDALMLLLAEVERILPALTLRCGVARRVMESVGHGKLDRIWILDDGLKGVFCYTHPNQCAEPDRLIEYRKCLRPEDIKALSASESEGTAEGR